MIGGALLDSGLQGRFCHICYNCDLKCSGYVRGTSGYDVPLATFGKSNLHFEGWLLLLCNKL